MIRQTRAAKRYALKALFQEYSSDDDKDVIPADISDDDVAMEREDVSSEETYIEAGTDHLDESFPEDVLVPLSGSSESDDSENGSTSESEDGEASTSRRAMAIRSEASLVSSNGTVWTTIRPNVGRQGLHNIVTPRHGFRKGLNPTSRSEAFEIFFETCVENALMHANLEGRRMARDQEIKWRKTDRTEMNAFIGLHLLAGAYKATHRDTEELWSESDGHPLFRATMSYERFKQLKTAVRFDDRRTRDHDDPLAPIRQVVDLFNTSLRENYEPGPHLCIDEQLIEFHGRVKFRRYIPTKPGKYGMLLYWVTEAKTSFPLRFLVYTGESTLTTAEKCNASSVPEALTMKLAEPYVGKGRNITADNYFISQSLAKRLMAAKTTLVGTLRSNRREVPAAAKTVKNRQKGDTVHFYNENITMCSFWDKKNCPVLLLSSFHRFQPNFTEGKSEIVHFYNATKSGVDNLDKLTRTYRCQRKCRRWPYGVYFTLVDVACIAALKLWTTGNSESHYFFKKALAKELCMPLIIQRSLLSKLKVSVRTAMDLVGVPREILSSQGIVGSVPSGQGRCHLCRRLDDRKSRIKCALCHQFVCQSHRNIVKTTRWDINKVDHFQVSVS